MTCVFVARDDSTLLTRALKWILRTTLAVFFPLLSTTALDCCPVDTSSSKTVRQHTQLVPRRTACSKPTAQISLPKTCGLQIHPTWTHVWGQCWRPITNAIRNRKRSPNWRKSCRWDSLPQGPIDKAVKGVSKRLKACVAAESGHFKHSQYLTAMSWLCYFCLNDVILLNDCLIFLSVWKSLGGNTVMPITLEHYKLIKCWSGCYVCMRWLNMCVKFRV